MVNSNSPSESPQLSLTRLWSFWFSAVAAWAVQLFVSYSLVEWYCVNAESISQNKIQAINLALTSVCFLIAFSSTIFAFRSAKKISSDDLSMQRIKFMVWGGMILSGFLGVTILMQGIPNLVLPLCNELA